jgi:hypothetical protein
VYVFSLFRVSLNVAFCFILRILHCR